MCLACVWSFGLDRREQFRRIGFRHTTKRRSSSVSSIRIWSSDFIFVCLDGDHCSQARHVSFLSCLQYVDSRKSGTGGNAVISLIFAEYINRIFWHGTSAEISPDEVPQWAIKLTAIGAVVVVTILCIATRKLGSRAAVVFTTVKVGGF